MLAVNTNTANNNNNNNDSSSRNNGNSNSNSNNSNNNNTNTNDDNNKTSPRQEPGQRLCGGNDANITMPQGAILQYLMHFVGLDNYPGWLCMFTVGLGLGRQRI